VELYLYCLYIPSLHVWEKLHISLFTFTDLQGKFFPPIVHGITIIWECVLGKAIPLQASTSPEGSRRLKLPDFKTIGT